MLRACKKTEQTNDVSWRQLGEELKAAREKAAAARLEADGLQEEVSGLETRAKGLEEELEGVRAALRESQDASDVEIGKLR